MAPMRRIGDALIAHALEEHQRIDDAIAREGIDHEPLLVGGDNLLRGGVDAEHALVEIFDVLDEGDLVVEPRVLDLALGLAEFEHKRLLGLFDREQRQEGSNRGDAEQDKDRGEEGSVHCWPSSAAAGAFLVNSESGR